MTKLSKTKFVRIKIKSRKNKPRNSKPRNSKPRKTKFGKYKTGKTCESLLVKSETTLVFSAWEEQISDNPENKVS